MSDTSLAFKIEPARKVCQEIEPLARENWETVRDMYPSSELAPNIALYLQAEDAGTLRVFTSRKDEVLVGYAIVFMMQHPHRMGDTVAQIETFFIRAKERSRGHAAQFLEYIETELRMLGVVTLTTASRDLRFDRWLSMRGYHQAVRVFERSLEWRH